MYTSDRKSRKGTKSSQATVRRKDVRGGTPKNRYLLEQSAESVGTSSKKLKLSKNEYDIDFDSTFGYRLLCFASVFSALSEVLVCHTCHKPVKFTEANKQGLGFKIVISCEACEPVHINSCPKINNKAYEVNRRMVLAMRLLGIGLNGIKKFCAFMDLPIFQKSYDEIIKTLREVSESVCSFSMKNAAQQEKIKSVEKGENNGITVSGDGSWRRRGFSSLFGVVSLIGWFSGKVVDVLVKSKFCKTCLHWKSKENTAEYEEWKKNHESTCEANHEGSAGKMEVDAATEMFARADEKNGVSYINYVGDGDCKTFKAIVEQNPNVKKKECIDHVQKRMGTRLRKLVSNTKGLSGRGKLTGKLIDELSIYYGLAIRRHCNSIEDMKKAIWATLYHKISTDEKPQHHFCPEGPKSWCAWQLQKAIVGNTNEFKHNPAMSDEVFKAIKPVYEELSRDDLLTRCLGGFTQNSNESFNSLVWSMAPKSSSSGKSVLDIVVNLAVLYFNDGFFGIMQVMKQMGISIGLSCYNFCSEANAARIAQSERSLSVEAREARSTSLSSRKDEEHKNLNLEGQLYGPGIAD